MIITYLPVVVYLHAVRSILQGADMLDQPTLLPPVMAAPCWCGGVTAAPGWTPPDTGNWMATPPFVTIGYPSF